MTKEDLEKEATEYALEWGTTTDGTYACCRDGYLAGAEPREKRIAELEQQLAISEHDREHNDYELTEVYKKIAELEAQIEKMKCCSNCVYLAGCDLSGYEECKNFDKWELREIKEK